MKLTPDTHHARSIHIDLKSSKRPVAESDRS
jgi:hypothetical protein